MSTFDTTYDSFPEATQTLYRSLAEHPGETILPEGLAALADIDEAQAVQLAEPLCETGVLVFRNGLYEVPASTHEDSAARAGQDTDAQRRARRIRLRQAYYRPLVAAELALHKQSQQYSSVFADFRKAFADGVWLSPFSDPASALSWFEQHQPTLAGLIRQAFDDDSLEMCDLVEASWGGMLKGGYHEWMREAHAMAGEIALRHQHPAAALMLVRESWALRLAGELPEAMSTAQRAADIAARRDDVWAESSAWSALRRAHAASGNYVEALAAGRESLRLAEITGEERSIVLRLRHVGEDELELGRVDAAVASLNSAAERIAAVDSEVHAGVLLRRARARLAQNNAQAALEDAQTALDAMRLAANPFGVAEAAKYAANAATELGLPQGEVLRYLTDSIAHYEQVRAYKEAQQIRDGMNAL